jgi:ribose transport system permease protein
MHQVTTAESTISEPGPGRRRFPAALRSRRLVQLGPTIALVGVSILISAVNHRFLTLDNLRSIVTQSAIPLVLSVGLTFIILSGAIDLSIEGVMAMSSVIVSFLVLNNRTNFDWGLLGVVAAILVGGLAGFLNGVIHVTFRIPSFMVTLGMWSVGIGLATVLYRGLPVTVEDPMLRSWALGTTLSFSNLAWFAIGALVVGYLVQRFTILGRYAYVIGGNEDLARLSGVPVNRYKVMLFTFAGLCSGLAGVLIAARTGYGTANVGTGTLFQVVTSVVVGGTALTGGTGGVLQTLVGVLFVTTLSNGMILMGIHPYIQQAVQGLLIIVAVALTMDRARVPIIK